VCRGAIANCQQRLPKFINAGSKLGAMSLVPGAAGQESPERECFRAGRGFEERQPDKTIQAILRHANLSTTMNVYVKSVGEDSVKAMQALQLCAQRALDANKTDCGLPN
jgi:hypothetical protein